ncbi:MAG: transporter substrate-binding domain-containing protein [Acetilactobacillus jinshanensis]
MKLFKKLSKTLLILVGVLGTGAILTACGNNTASSELVQPHTLTIGMTGDFPPYSYKSNGKLTGYEVNVARDIAKQMHLKPKFRETKWDGLIAGLGSRRYDAVLNDITVVNGSSRAKHFLSSKPYMYSRSVLITNVKNNKIKTLHNIKGYKFAEGIGTANQRIAKHYGANVVPSTDFTSTMSLISEGRVDGCVNSLDSWNGYAKTHSTKGLRVYAIPNGQYQAGAVAVLLAKHSPKLRNQINKALETLRKNGTLKRLSEKYLKSNETVNKSFGGVISDQK